MITASIHAYVSVSRRNETLWHKPAIQTKEYIPLYLRMYQKSNIACAETVSKGADMAHMVRISNQPTQKDCCGL